MTASMVYNSGPGCGSHKPVILVVSCGTSCRDSRTNAIGAVENAIAAAHPAYEVRRAFTSRIIISAIRQHDGEEIEHVEQALDRLSQDGVKALIVQPTHIICGDEYRKLAAVVERYREQFDTVCLGTPLLTDRNDAIRLAHALTDAAAEYSDEDTAIVLMGHGAAHEENAPCIMLQNAFAAIGRRNFFVGTMKSVPTLDDTIASVKAGGWSKVMLFPLMITAGNHAQREMAGDSADSWESVLEANGFEVHCILRGLGELQAIQELYIARIRACLASSNSRLFGIFPP